MPDQSFEYCVTDGHKLLPIDYSRNELGQKWGVDPRTVVKYVANSYLLKDSLSELAGPLAGAYGNKTSFPVEAEFFLKAYFDHAQSLKLSGKEVSQEKIQTLFTKLCETLYSEICTQQDSEALALGPDSVKFYRHALFQNDGFSTYTMKQLWQEQLNLRFSQITSLAESISAEKQAEALQDCLVALDRVCLSLIQAKESSSESPDTSAKGPSGPKELLDKLLGPRRKLIPSRGCYKLTNSKLTYPGKEEQQTISLETAFKKLQCTKFPNRELMKQARITYMRDLAVHAPLSDFEKRYNELSRYLDLLDIELDETALREKIISEMKPLFVIEICNCCYYTSPEAVQAECFPATYFEAFLLDKSKSFVQDGIKIFNDSVDLVQAITVLRQKYDRLPPNVPDNNRAFEQFVYRNVVIPHIIWFVRAWAFINRKEPAFDNAKLQCPTENDIVEMTQYVSREAFDFSRKGLDAVSYFGEPAKSAYKHSQITENAESQCHVKQVLNVLNKDLVLGICLVFQRIAEDLAIEVSKSIKLFQKYKNLYS